MNTWKQKSRLTQANLTSEPSANLAQEQSPMVRYFQEAAAGEQSHPLELDKQMRSRMERQFGLDFSAVRLVESDLPGKLGADAVAQGDLIRFAPDTFHPETAQGEQLLSHELSHVVQQSRGTPGGKAGLPLYDAALERGADIMAAQAMAGELAAGPVQAFSPISSVQAPMQGGGGASKVSPPVRGGGGSSTPSPLVQDGGEPPTPTDEELIDLYRSYSENDDEEEEDVPGWLKKNVAEWLQAEGVNAKKPKRPNWLFVQENTPENEKKEREALKKRYYEARTAWENRVQFNPQNDRDFGTILDSIDTAKTVQAAQDAFKQFLGRNDKGLFIKGDIGGIHMNEMNLRSVKLRLKGMARMVKEFPQLRGQIDSFGGVLDPNIVMNSGNIPKTIGWGSDKGSYMYGQNDKKDPIDYHEARREMRENERKRKISSGRWDGTHELGHILQYMLNDQLKDRNYSSTNNNPDPEADQRVLANQALFERMTIHSHITAASVVHQAISQLLQDETLEENTKTNLKLFIRVHTSPESNLEPEQLIEKLDLLDYASMSPVIPDLLGKRNPDFSAALSQKAVEYKNKLQDLCDIGLTSEYGATSIAELFAEAFADYYGNGEKANPLSKKIVEIVKEQTAGQTQSVGQEPTTGQAQSAPIPSPTEAQKMWATKERIKEKTLIYDLLDLKKMSDEELKKKREAEQARKGGGYIHMDRSPAS